MHFKHKMHNIYRRQLENPCYRENQALSMDYSDLDMKVLFLYNRICGKMRVCYKHTVTEKNRNTRMVINLGQWKECSFILVSTTCMTWENDFFLWAFISFANEVKAEMR